MRVTLLITLLIATRFGAGSGRLPSHLLGSAISSPVITMLSPASCSRRMHFVSEDGEERLLPLERIDLSQTVRLNRERNVEFILQSKDAVVQ